MTYPPCQNPSCKSFGTSHPNCKCYGNAMAEGGEAKRFCSKDQDHEPGCEYGGASQDPSEAVGSYLANEGLHNLIKMGSDNSSEALDKYNGSIKKGGKKIDNRVDSLFKGKPFENEDHEKSKKAIHDWVSKGGITNEIQQELYNQSAPVQAMAEGGEAVSHAPSLLKDHPLAYAHPEQNMMLQMAKGRMSNYLNGLRPQENIPKLAFDHKPDQTAQKKSYDKALHIAAHPLSVLEHVQKGTIEPEHLNHLKNLHPEVDNLVQKKMTEKMIESQLKGETPSYKVRQGLSMVLGAPLSSEMTQPNMQAIQATFQSKQSQSQDQGAPKKSTAALSKTSQSYLTRDEALTSRQQRK